MRNSSLLLPHKIYQYSMLTINIISRPTSKTKKGKSYTTTKDLETNLIKESELTMNSKFMQVPKKLSKLKMAVGRKKKKKKGRIHE